MDFNDWLATYTPDPNKSQVDDLKAAFEAGQASERHKDLDLPLLLSIFRIKSITFHE